MPPITTVHLPSYDLVSIDEPTLHILQGLLSLVRPRFVAEAGTYQGHFALTVGAVIQNARLGGRVYTFDPRDCGIGKWLTENGITTVEYRQESFDDILALYPHLEGLCDVVFIDSGDIGEHQPGTRDDMRWQHYLIGKKLLRAGGLMFVDDVAGQWTNVETIRKECLILEAARGIAIWQKPYE